MINLPSLPDLPCSFWLNPKRTKRSRKHKMFTVLNNERCIAYRRWYALFELLPVFSVCFCSCFFGLLNHRLSGFRDFADVLFTHYLVKPLQGLGFFFVFYPRIAFTSFTYPWLLMWLPIRGWFGRLKLNLRFKTR